MVQFYDRNGEPISVGTADRLLRNDGYRRVAWDEVGDFVISTVWLGLDLSFYVGPPLIFETAVFADDPMGGTVRRYPTESAALAGHQAMIEVCRLEQQLRS